MRKRTPAPAAQTDDGSGVPGTTFRGLTDEERGLIREALMGVAQAATKVIDSVAGPAPRTGSRYAADLGSDLNDPTAVGGNYVNQAMLRVLNGSLAGIDHVKAFVYATRGNWQSVSASTLARGGLEAFSKPWYILAAPDTAVLLARHAALAAHELKHTVTHGRLMLADGTEIDPRAYKEDLVGMPTRNGIQAAEQVSMTDLAVTLLDALPSRRKTGRATYSALSSAAHGEATAVSTFLIAETGRVRLRLPAILAYEYVGILFLSCKTVIDALVDYAGLGPAECTSWHSAVDRVMPAFREIVSRSVTPDEIIRRHTRPR